MPRKKSKGWQKKKSKSPNWIKKAGKVLESIVKGHTTDVGMSPQAIKDALAAIKRHEAVKELGDVEAAIEKAHREKLLSKKAKGGKVKKLARGGPPSGGLPVDEDKWASVKPWMKPRPSPFSQKPLKLTGKGSGKYKGEAKAYKAQELAATGSGKYKGKKSGYGKVRTAAKKKTWNYS